MIMCMWFEKRGEQWFLLDKEGHEYDVNEKWHGDWKTSKEDAEEWSKARAYMKAKNVWDATAFGACMSAMIADAVTMVDGELKILVSSTVHCAERELFRYYGQAFKRKCLRRVEEFYSKKEYQTKIRFERQNREEWNDHALRPIVMLVNVKGELEAVPRHKVLAQMDICPLEDTYTAVWFERGKFDVEDVLRAYEKMRQ